jgi:hypothetical protein
MGRAWCFAVTSKDVLEHILTIRTMQHHQFLAVDEADPHCHDCPYRDNARSPIRVEDAAIAIGYILGGKPGQPPS